MKKYRVGIIGLGRMSSTLDEEDHPYHPRAIAACCQAMDQLELVAGADLLEAKREAFRHRWGVNALYEDYREMVQREKLDLVAVCTTASGLQKPARQAPDSAFRGDSHADLAIDLAEAGVPMLYVEKAMASSTEKADAVKEACNRHGTLFNSGVSRRFTRTYEQVRDAIERGEIGEPKAGVHYGSSSLMHGHIHSIDTLCYLLGDPLIEAVRGELRPRDLTIEENHIPFDPNAVYQVEFAGGVEATTVPAAPWEFEILGTEGSIRSLNNGGGILLRKKRGRRGSRDNWEEAPIDFTESTSPFVICLEDLVDAYEKGRPTRGCVDIAHRVTEACIAVAESHRLGGKWIDLPMNNRGLYVFHV